MCGGNDDGQCCDGTGGILGGFKVDAVVSVDERGQMVLPKEVRRKADLRPGDKLALVTCEKDGKVTCMTLMKVDALADMVRSKLGPVLREALGEQ